MFLLRKMLFKWSVRMATDVEIQKEELISWPLIIYTGFLWNIFYENLLMASLDDVWYQIGIKPSNQNQWWLISPICIY